MASNLATTTETSKKPRKPYKPAASFLDDLPDAALVGRNVWESALACSGATVGRRIKDGTIPPPCVWLTSCTPRWRAGIVRATLARIVDRRQAGA
jgi:hypothetical protein